MCIFVRGHYILEGRVVKRKIILFFTRSSALDHARAHPRLSCVVMHRIPHIFTKRSPQAPGVARVLSPGRFDHLSMAQAPHSFMSRGNALLFQFLAFFLEFFQSLSQFSHRFLVPRHISRLALDRFFQVLSLLVNVSDAVEDPLLLFRNDVAQGIAGC